MDGNRRWARSQGLPTYDGHKQGYLNLKEIGKIGIKRGIKFISAFVLSTQNLNRSQEEVDYLMKLLYWVATKEVEELNKENIRVRVLGSRDNLSPKILKAIDAAEETTAKNTAGTLALCLNYTGHQELADAAAKMVKEGVNAEDITIDKFAEYLYAPDIPPIDLVIRTSGEQRISDFMLWRSAWSELRFVDKHWPDFNEADLDAAIKDYATRHRRFGK